MTTLGPTSTLTNTAVGKMPATRVFKWLNDTCSSSTANRALMREAGLFTSADSPTRQGRRLLVQMRLTESGLKDVATSAVMERSILIRRAAAASYSRYAEFYNGVRSAGFANEPQVAMFAAGLASAEGSFQSLFSDAEHINDQLYNLKWQSYKRLPIVAATAGNHRDLPIEQRWSSLVDTFAWMYTGKGDYRWNKSYDNWLASAAIVARGKYVHINRSLFSRLVGSLQAKKWKIKATVPSMLLGSVKTSPGEDTDSAIPQLETIASGVTNTYNSLTRMRYAHSAETEIASALLYSRGQHLEDPTKEFDYVRGAMQGYGWYHHTCISPVAAHLAVLPGNRAERIWIATQFLEQLRNANMPYPRTTLAVALTQQTYRQFAATLRNAEGATANGNDDTPGTLASPVIRGSVSDTSYLESGLVGGLVGDMIDDSSINLSLGFGAGLILGLIFPKTVRRHRGKLTGGSIGWWLGGPIGAGVGALAGSMFDGKKKSRTTRRIDIEGAVSVPQHLAIADPLVG